MILLKNGIDKYLEDKKLPLVLRESGNSLELAGKDCGKTVAKIDLLYKKNYTKAERSVLANTIKNIIDKNEDELKQTIAFIKETDKALEKMKNVGKDKGYHISEIFGTIKITDTNNNTEVKFNSNNNHYTEEINIRITGNKEKVKQVLSNIDTYYKLAYKYLERKREYEEIFNKYSIKNYC